MNIGIFTDTYLPDINGVVTSIESLRRGLEDLGNNVYIVCPANDISVLKHEGNIIKIPGFEIKKMYGYTLTLPIHFEVIEETEKLKLDVIHIQTEFGIGVLASIIASSLNIPLVWTYHTSYEDYTHYLNKFEIKRVDDFIKDSVSKLSRMYSKSCMALITPSTKIKNKLNSYDINIPIKVVPSGVDLNHFSKENISISEVDDIRKTYGIDCKLFIYVGRIAKEKAIDELIEVFAQLKNDGVKAKLLIVGDGPFLNELKVLVEKNNLNDYVFLLGKVKYRDIPSFYYASDAFISASLSETQGLTFIEALASGLVVWGKDKELLKELIANDYNGYLFSDNKELISQIKDFVCFDQKEYQTMSKQAIKTSEEYGIDAFAKKVLAIYKEVIINYHNQYTVSKISLKNDFVLLNLEKRTGEKDKLYLSIDDYSDNHINKDSKISESFFKQYKNKEKQLLAYQTCLKKLSSKDYSIWQIKDYLSKKYDLERKEKEEIINKLIELGLLNDENLVKAKINNYKNSFYSNKMIKTKLKKVGIDEVIINNYLEDNSNDELDFAAKKANKYFLSIKNKPARLKQQLIINKLINDGFSGDVAREVVEKIDFKGDEENENSLIRNEFLKIKKKYERKYAGKELKNKIYMALVSRGFNYDNIREVIEELEVEDGE